MLEDSIKTPRSAKWKHFEGSFLNRCLIFEVRKGYATPKKLWGYSSAGRAPALQAGGQRFDPAYLHQIWAHSSGG